MDGIKTRLKKLVSIYVFITFLTTIIVGLPHLFPQPYFMPLRFPHYLEMMPVFLGISWPITFEIYHYVLYVLAIIGIVNLLGIIFYSKLKSLAIASSLIGLFSIPLMVLFFFFVFINVNPSTAIIYGIYSIILLIVDILTFKILIIRRKGA